MTTHPPVRYPAFDGTQACLGDDRFIKEARGEWANRLNAECKAVCQTCSWIKPCGDYALRHEMHGVMGGMSALDRQKIRRARNIPFESPEVLVYGRAMN